MALDLISEFTKKMENVDLNVYGVLDTSGNIHTLGTDSKIIGRVFEMITEPLLREIANEHHLILTTPEGQTIYPDFILFNPKNNRKIAIDVKTTYLKKNRKGENKTIFFSLGSFCSYMRDNKKNIEGHYSDYSNHYVIGFIYERNGKAQQSDKYKLNQTNQIEIPYKNVQYFIQEKYKIAGEKTGSGNTENIGSIKTKNFQDFEAGNGPFSYLGKDIYNLYWSYYPKYRESNKNYTNLNEFITWFEKQKMDLPVRHNPTEKYTYTDIMKIINDYKEHVKKSS